MLWRWCLRSWEEHCLPLLSNHRAAQQEVELREPFCVQNEHSLARSPLLDISPQGRHIQATLLRTPWRDWLLSAGLASIVLALTAIVLKSLIDCFFSSPSQRGWVLLGLMYYIGATWNFAWQKLVVILGRIRYIRVVIKRTGGRALFEAVTKRLQSLAEKSEADFGSRDVEAFTQYDNTTGMHAVKLSFWGDQPRRFNFQLKLPPGAGSHVDNKGLNVTVEYTRGEDVICGRDHHVEKDLSIVLWMRSSPDHAAEDKVLLQNWCQDCVVEAMAPPPDRVEVYGLQESSRDWVPEWQLERTRALKSSSQTGDGFYLEQKVFNEIIADARIWAKRSLRLYMVTGPPGVGKTEFTVWLAGSLRLPIYRLSLTMDSLTDARLAQMLSQTMMKHEAVVVQIDEFQEVLRRWDTIAPSGQGISVTPGGFNEILQGSTTFAKGVIVLTGTADVASDPHRCTYPALFRRFQIQIKLPYLTLHDAKTFFCSFLLEFVNISGGELEGWADQFCSCLEEHGPKDINIDMLKQFLMRHITQAHAAGRLSAALGIDRYTVKPGHTDEFLKLLVCGASMEQFFQAYTAGREGIHHHAEEASEV